MILFLLSITYAAAAVAPAVFAVASAAFVVAVVVKRASQVAAQFSSFCHFLFARFCLYEEKE